MSAVISECGLYRYQLLRDLGGPQKTIAWIMVNPSTADAEADDATIRKVRGFTRRAGFSHLVVGNKFAYRATDVRALRAAADPVGPDNDGYLHTMMLTSDRVVVAWGPLAKLPVGLRDRWRGRSSWPGPTMTPRWRRCERTPHEQPHNRCRIGSARG